ncbi:MAG: SDR family oxidoreductase [Anaerolineae bacterium]|nr:SDR family oxidoreductase [Anaerolineae bacterium]
MANQPIAIVTGANRGIGLEVCRQLGERGYVAVLGSRDLAKGQQATAQLQVSNGAIVAQQLDVSDLESIENLRAWVEAEYGCLDVLVNNAAINYDTWQRAVNADLGNVRETLETNIFGAWQMTQAFLPLLRKSPHPRIVNVSSESGSLASMGGGTPGYSLSKAGLNALTRMLAAELRGGRILVNAVCPGWVATDMGGAGGRPVEQGAASVLWAVTLPDNGTSGGFYRDGKPVPW